MSGHFNILHPGHIRLLRYAKSLGKKLIVAVESNRVAGKAAHITEKLRLDAVKSLSWVDESFIFDEPIEKVILKLKPDIVVKGKEHESKINKEVPVLKKYGGKILFSSGEVTFSSLDLIQKEFQTQNSKLLDLDKAYLKRHQINAKKLIESIKNFTKLKICVIGDLIIDEYITCDPLGMSQEDPTIVVRPIDSHKFIGGAGIVASHAKTLGAKKVYFFSVAGADENKDYALQMLSNNLISSHIYIDKNRPTTFKQRFRSKGKTLLRVNYLNQISIELNIQKKIINKLKKIIHELDLIIFSDFNYGCLPQELVDQITSLAKKNKIFIAADSQSSSQTGDVGRFKNIDLITPTERELRISLKNYEDGLIILAENFRKITNAKNIILKLGEDGVIIHGNHNNSNNILTDQILALNQSPKDTAGAGDSMLVACAMALASGSDIWQASFLGSLAAGVQVSRVGNIPIKDEDLIKEIY